MPRRVMHLHPLLLANISRMDNRQETLSLAEFERLYCEPASSTQPPAHSTSTQPPGSYHAVAPPDATPEAIVHYYSYAITNEDCPTHEEFLTPAHPTRPLSDPSGGASDAVVMTRADPLLKPRMLTPWNANVRDPDWTRPGSFDATGHLPHLAHAALMNVPPRRRRPCAHGAPVEC
ncbi:hypothetical protein CYMTET_17050 [Cymbomonas tetramitiformis]|uniref:Uncharacterized protein n=1 Tax=Cymbomonas tetramitiformis TaxID=36881 RepID=A0AAE0GAW2_9CHLO|nr:hypothetical protein CYMTET_17050 [Cymbomonas tetramitiformis]